MHEYYTVADIMGILRVSKNYAYKLVSSDGFPSIKIGKLYRIPREEFEVWCERHIGKEVKI